MDSRDVSPALRLILLVAAWVRWALSLAVVASGAVRSRLAMVLPDPARAAPALDVAAALFHAPECATSPAAAAARAMTEDRPLLVFAMSPLNPECVALLADLANTADESLAALAAVYVPCVVDVTAAAMEPEVPAALRDAVALPAAALYVPARRGREFALVATAEGVGHATTVAALMEEVLLRTHRLPPELAAAAPR